MFHDAQNNKSMPVKAATAGFDSVEPLGYSKCNYHKHVGIEDRYGEKVRNIRRYSKDGIGIEKLSVLYVCVLT